MPEARRVAGKPTANWSLNTTAAVALSGSRPSISQPAARLPSASVSPPGMMLASVPDRRRASLPGSRVAFCGTRCAPAVDVEEPAVAELEEMAGGEPAPVTSSVRTTSIPSAVAARAMTTVGVWRPRHRRRAGRPGLQ
jgi:hypothetical protein